MTMPGRFYLQKLLRQMADAGCRYAVVETSSQGLIQSRHIGINYDIAVWTNLTPEHIEAHGGFENYKAAKRRLFSHVASCAHKQIDGKPVPKFAVVNADREHAEYYASTPGLMQVVWYGIGEGKGERATGVVLEAEHSSFTYAGIACRVPLPGEFNVENAMAALATCKALEVDVAGAAAKLARIVRVPGRFERVDLGQPWTVIVDYAVEPVAFRKLYETLERLPHQRLIHVYGSCGGGRDVSRRPLIGKLGGEKADVVIVTNEDPYDDDPRQIIDQVAAGALEAGKVLETNLFKIPDRRLAIQKAMELAKPGDMVVLTGKGHEPWICVEDGKKVPWDEVAVSKDAISRVWPRS
jgi:UDP-N-acetylmuramoyl-L-alanyl-D-glutamate--2,6-diaminopimelate ligase